MEIVKGIEIHGKALWIKKEKILVLGDVHIGYEEALAKQGYLVPRTMFKELKEEIEELLRLKPKLIVINGDLKHEFGEISIQEWQETLEIIDMMLKTSRVVLLKGNHDKILEPIARKRAIEIRDFFIINDIAILHGDKMMMECLDKKVKILIIGHDHPAVLIDDGIKKEKFKCFLAGKYKDKKVIMHPSFFPLVEGADIKREDLFSPFLSKKSIRDFEVYVVGDKTYDFGRVKDI